MKKYSFVVQDGECIYGGESAATALEIYRATTSGEVALITKSIPDRRKKLEPAARANRAQNSVPIDPVENSESAYDTPRRGRPRKNIVD